MPHKNLQCARASLRKPEGLPVVYVDGLYQTQTQCQLNGSSKVLEMSKQSSSVQSRQLYENKIWPVSLASARMGGKWQAAKEGKREAETYLYNYGT